MRRTTLICLCTMLACNSLKKDEVRDFIPGTYVKQVSNQYANGHDTIVIVQLSSAGNSYEVERRVGFQRLSNHKALPTERRTERWNCIFKEEDKVLYETVKGKVISFLPESKALRVGFSEYKKVSDAPILNNK